MEIETVQRTEYLVLGHAEFQYADNSAGVQDAVDFGDSPGDIFEIAHAEGDGHGIERIVFRRQVFGISLHECNALFQPGLRDFLAPDREHLLGQIDAGNGALRTFACEHDCQVAGAGGQVEDRCRFCRVYAADHFAPP